MKRSLFLRKMLGLAAAPIAAKVIDPTPYPFPEALKEIKHPKKTNVIAVYGYGPSRNCGVKVYG